MYVCIFVYFIPMIDCLVVSTGFSDLSKIDLNRYAKVSKVYVRTESTYNPNIVSETPDKFSMKLKQCLR